MSNQTKNRLSVSINQQKKEEFKRWCLENNLNVSEFINQFIDSCLSGENFNISTISFKKNDHEIDTKIKLIVEKAIASLHGKIAELEIKLQSISLNSNLELSSINTLTVETSIENEVNEEKRQYLSRTEAWQKLKQTNYIKTNGYDSFLRATPAEFPLYDIYYDWQKKRYYIINN
jgi:hypothetical protein